MSNFHRIRIHTVNGLAALTHIQLDGKELRGVERVAFEVGYKDAFGGKSDGLARLTLNMVADVEVLSDVQDEYLKQYWRRLDEQAEAATEAEAT